MTLGATSAIKATRLHNLQLGLSGHALNTLQFSTLHFHLYTLSVRFDRLPIKNVRVRNGFNSLLWQSLWCAAGTVDWFAGWINMLMWKYCQHRTENIFFRLCITFYWLNVGWISRGMFCEGFNTLSCCLLLCFHWALLYPPLILPLMTYIRREAKTMFQPCKLNGGGACTVIQRVTWLAALFVSCDPCCLPLPGDSPVVTKAPVWILSHVGPLRRSILWAPYSIHREVGRFFFVFTCVQPGPEGYIEYRNQR